MTEAEFPSAPPSGLPYPHACPADGDPFAHPPVGQAAPPRVAVDGVGVLLTAYGGPSSLDEVPAYYTDIRGGRPPEPALLEELMGRYRAIGGRSPLPTITEAQRQGLASELARRGLPLPVIVGYKHSAPSIAEAVAAAAGSGLRHLVVIPLAPHFSTMTACTYCRRVDTARRGIDLDGPLTYTIVADWHAEPGLVATLARRTAETLATWHSSDGGPRGADHVVFTAHSLPERILAQGDPYPHLLRETARLVAAELGLTAWSFAFQSAGRTTDPWLGPDLLAQLDALAGRGVRRVLVTSVGFVTTNLELLYDIDIEARSHAARLGVELRRAPAPDDDPRFIAALADLVQRVIMVAPSRATTAGAGEATA